MSTKIGLAAAVSASLVSLAVGGYLGFRLAAPRAPAPADATVILTALRDRGFLVTETYVFDEPVTIDRSTGNALKDFFVGETITARGAMQANLGIDLASIGADDVTVTDGSITVRIPQATLLDVSPVGPLEVNNDRGVLKRLFSADDGYNVALAELSKQAQAAATASGPVGVATDRAKDEVARILGYVAPGKTVTVEVK